MKICELVLALPLEDPLYEAFSLLFSPITGHFFMDLWKKYDCDDSGTNSWQWTYPVLNCRVLYSETWQIRVALLTIT